MNNLSMWLTVMAGLLAICFIVLRAWKGGLLAMVLKAFASFGFVTMGILGLAVSEIENKIPLGFIVIGLVLGMIGDILLDLKVLYDNDEVYLNFGMLSFGLGHIMYFVALTILALKSVSSVLIPVLIGVGSALVLTFAIIIGGKKFMKLDFGDFLWQTIVYTFELTFMTVYTLVLAIIGGGLWLTFVAILLFLLSDAVLSNQYFGGKLHDKVYIVINHVLYYSAQILIAMLLFII